MNDWKKYKNGNVDVYINLDNGTKIRMTKDNDYHPEFPENADVTISTYCTHGCKFCYAGCSQNGSHADLFEYKKLLDSLNPNTELAVNINSEIHPQFEEFLQYMKDRGVIVNATLRQDDFERYHEKIEEWCDRKLLHGVGISLICPNVNFVLLARKNPNYVIHTIAGITPMDHFKALADYDLKVLILGYKTTHRGNTYYEENKNEICGAIFELSQQLSWMVNHFAVVSFDNMAIDQLGVEEFLTPKEFEEFYMGEEGQFTMAINLVDGTYAKNSTSSRLYPLNKDMTITDIFQDMQKRERI